MIDRSPQQRRFLMRCSLAFPIGLGVLLTSCSAMPSDIVARQNARQSLLSADAAANGRGGVMPAYYDAELFTINFKEEPGGAEQALLAHNGSINTIYMCDACEAAGFMFTSVLDAIQGDGFNPLWREVQITFNAGHTPRQLFSDNEVAAVAAAGEITLTATNEVYRCSVIGPTK